jgi:hypothetical protein
MSSPDDIYENEISRLGPLSPVWRVESCRNKPVNRVKQQREWESVEACNPHLLAFEKHDNGQKNRAQSVAELGLIA